MGARQGMFAFLKRWRGGPRPGAHERHVVFGGCGGRRALRWRRAEEAVLCMVGGGHLFFCNCANNAPVKNCTEEMKGMREHIDCFKTSCLVESSEGWSENRECLCPFGGVKNRV